MGFIMFPTLESRSDILKMLDEMTEYRNQLLSLCKSLSEEQLADPVYPGTWSLLQNLSHLAWAEEFMLAWIQNRPEPLSKEEYPPEPKPTMEAVADALDEAHTSVIAFVKGNDEAVLREKCQYVPHRGEQTVGGILYHLVEHEIGHRTFAMHKLKKLRGE